MKKLTALLLALLLVSNLSDDDTGRKVREAREKRKARKAKA